MTKSTYHSPIVGVHEFSSILECARVQRAREFLDKARDVVAIALEAGMTPNYLFVDEDINVYVPNEICGLKVWITKLPKPHKIIAVSVPDIVSGGP